MCLEECDGEAVRSYIYLLLSVGIYQRICEVETKLARSENVALVDSKWENRVSHLSYIESAFNLPLAVLSLAYREEATM